MISCPLRARLLPLRSPPRHHDITRVDNKTNATVRYDGISQVDIRLCGSNGSRWGRDWGSWGLLLLDLRLDSWGWGSLSLSWFDGSWCLGLCNLGLCNGWRDRGSGRSWLFNLCGSLGRLHLRSSSGSWNGWSSLSSSGAICWGRFGGFGGLSWLLGLLGGLALQEALELGLEVGERVGRNSRHFGKEQACYGDGWERWCWCWCWVRVEGADVKECSV
ncbi:hypothetical protein DL95DRAFT_392080 [Leptodontidium sp. 2 PMI_412]|nr:hypothetical protein DL95DRAFT_392080 [Leptodontidium sp. 2 PMI_412]